MSMQVNLSTTRQQELSPANRASIHPPPTSTRSKPAPRSSVMGQTKLEHPGDTRPRRRRGRTSSPQAAQNQRLGPILLSLCLSCVLASTQNSAQNVIQERSSIIHDSSSLLDSAAQPEPLASHQLGQSLSQVSEAAGGQANSANHYRELLVRPHTPVRIECRLPQLYSTNERTYNWIYQPTGSSKPVSVCLEHKCLGAPSLGLKLESDPNSNAYDLVINNVTYEANDGSYYCDYRDSENKQTINREYRLTVLIPPQQPSIVFAGPSSVAREGQEFSLSCLSSGANPEPNMSWFRNDQPLVAQPGLRIEQTRANGTSASSLTWIPSIDDHLAAFRCAIWNKAMAQGQSLERELKLQVEYAPRLTVGPFNPLRILQGQSATLSCQVDANPPVKGVRWLRDGLLIGHQFNHTLTELTTRDSAVYSCQADNGIPPFNPLQAQAQPQQPQASSNSQASSASFFSLLANPFGQAPGPQERVVSSVEAQLQVQVLYGPRVQVRPANGLVASSAKTLALNEGDSLTLNCSVDASPPPHEFVWTRADEPSFRLSQTHQLLEFAQIGAHQMGNYTCTASNRLEASSANGLAPIEKQASASLQVNVRHKPGLAHIQVGGGGKVELGNNASIQCHARPAGYPEPRYRFWKYTGHKSQVRHEILAGVSGNTLNIQKTKLEDETRYVCLAANELGQSNEAEAELVVNELPMIWKDHSRPGALEDARFVGESAFTINFKGTGRPQPNVTWYHRSPIDGRRHELSGPDMAQRFTVETVNQVKISQHNGLEIKRTHVMTTLRFKQPLALEDRGLYSVEFSNDLSASAIEDFQLHIFHAPTPATTAAQLRAGPPPTQLTYRMKAGFNLGDTAQLVCRVSAYPRPDFTWQPNTGEVDKNLEFVESGAKSRYHMQVTNIRDDIWESTVSFSDLNESDYGDYTCAPSTFDKQTNTINTNLLLVVALSPKSKPEPPSQLEALDVSQDSLTLQWAAGFDGGFPNVKYLVQYAPDDASGTGLVRRFPESALMSGGEGQQADGQPRVFYFDCHDLNPCTISQLNSRQGYTFRVRARNELGVSDFSNELHATTRPNLTQIPRIQEASFDAARNVLHFIIEQGLDYTPNTLNARVEYQEHPTVSNHNLNPMHQADFVASNNNQEPAFNAEWRLHSWVQVRQERAETTLNVAPSAVDQLRLTLCSRFNETLCGQEYVVSMRSATSSFLQEQRHLTNLNLIGSTLALIVLAAMLATGLHSKCFSKPKKTTGSTERVDAGSLMDAKPGSGGPKSGSTTSTNSTSANGAGITNPNANGLINNHNNNINGMVQSMDSLMMSSQHALPMPVGNGNASDHSSDHSRQAKMDSMMPPNYNHYADRDALMHEQQQHQQQLYMQSPYGTSGQNSNALLGMVSQNSPALMGHQPFSYTALGTGRAPYGQTGNEQQQPISLDAAHLFGAAGLGDPMESLQQQQASLWNQSAVANDDYSINNYNNNALINGLAYQSQQQSAGGSQQQPIEPAYGILAAQQQAAAIYDNRTNNNSNYHQSAYLDPEQLVGATGDANQQSGYQQELHQQQQSQIYGSLNRQQAPTNEDQLQLQQQLIDHTNNQHAQLDPIYNTAPMAQANGLLSQQQQQQQQNLESDYGTIGGSGRNGRVIREIIV